MNLNTSNNALATELNCDSRIQSVFGCPLGSDNEGSFAIATAKTVSGEKEKNHNIVIDAIDSASEVSATVSESNGGNTNTNIESQIPSTISAIPFP
ncbi:MAG TPA: hypothetical protein VE130_15015 [Nitrososphaeraceae archaeon]|nr:hypothetical protein [Nitrososphaeraceae archaeon]